jgi:hypothetical protein
VVLLASRRALEDLLPTPRGLLAPIRNIAFPKTESNKEGQVSFRDDGDLLEVASEICTLFVPWVTADGDLTVHRKAVCVDQIAPSVRLFAESQRAEEAMAGQVLYLTLFSHSLYGSVVGQLEGRKWLSPPP